MAQRVLQRENKQYKTTKDGLCVSKRTNGKSVEKLLNKICIYEEKLQQQLRAKKEDANSYQLNR